MKKLVLILIFLLTPFCLGATMPKGSFIRVYPNETISTMLNQEGDIVAFINPADLWIGDKKVIPVNSILKGYINFLKLPIQGINGAFSIRITELYVPGSGVKKINGIVEMNGKTMIGGGLAPPASYRYSVHPSKVRPYLISFPQGYLQYVPSGEYEFGEHTTIRPSDILFIVLEEDVEF